MKPLTMSNEARRENDAYVRGIEDYNKGRRGPDCNPYYPPPFRPLCEEEQRLADAWGIGQDAAYIAEQEVRSGS